MNPTLKLVCLLALVAVSQSSVAIDKNARQAFDELMVESGLHMQTPQNYVDVPIQANPVFPYEHAIKHESGAMEMRFIVRPLSRILIDYTDPHNAAPEPNHLFPLLFESITNQLSTDSDTPNNTFSESAAQDHFNAHWAAAAAFDVNPEFSPGYRSAVLIGMHKNQVADAYTLFLYNDHEQAKTLINAAISTLSFTRATVTTQ